MSMTDQSNSISTHKHIAIVGATGAVGIEMIRVLERRNYPVASMRLLASPRSAGKSLEFRGAKIVVEPLNESSFEGIDIALFSAGGGISKEFAPHAVKAGAIVVDNSSAFRMDPGVPLIVPEINAADAASHAGILANPNCTTAITLMAVYPLHQAFGLKRIIASSYQAVSGTGARAIEELRDQVEAISGGRPVTREVYPHQIAFNVLPHVDSFLDDGYTREEMKMQNEGRRIMHLPDFTASVTCVRVPVYRAHSVAVTAEFEESVSIEKAREILMAAPGIILYDDPSKDIYPMPIECSGEDDCRVGRLRLDCALPNALTFWVSGDQLLKGAALNAVQIAELL
jgi:aspartate-semialdehyde dehydrogenase